MADAAEEIEAARRAIPLWDLTNKGRNANANVLDELAGLSDGKFGCELPAMRRGDGCALAPRIEPATPIFANGARSRSSATSSSSLIYEKAWSFLTRAHRDASACAAKDA